MLSVLCLFLSTMLSVFRSRAALQVEILALRYQIHCAPMLRQETADVDLGAVSSWAWLSGAWADSRSVLVIVKSETVIAWHRKGFRRIREPPTTCSGRPREAGRSGSVTCLPVRPALQTNAECTASCRCQKGMVSCRSSGEGVERLWRCL